LAHPSFVNSQTRRFKSMLICCPAAPRADSAIAADAGPGRCQLASKMSRSRFVALQSGTLFWRGRSASAARLQREALIAHLDRLGRGVSMSGMGPFCGGAWDGSLQPC
jgi:hypothetical protein